MTVSDDPLQLRDVVLQQITQFLNNEDVSFYPGMEANVHELKTFLAGIVDGKQSSSLLLVGPRGSGKSKLLEICLREYSSHNCSDPDDDEEDEEDSSDDDDVERGKVCVVRLHGWIHTDDRLAIQEIIRCLNIASREFSEFIKTPRSFADCLSWLQDAFVLQRSTLEPPNRRPQGKGRGRGSAVKSGPKTINGYSAVVIILDEFDLFAMHPKQTLLYNLFDMVSPKGAAQEEGQDHGQGQGLGTTGKGKGRGGKDAGAGGRDPSPANVWENVFQIPLAIIGVTCRWDAIELLEKRVRSRFSNRQLALSLPENFSQFSSVILRVLQIGEAQARGNPLFQVYNAKLEELFASANFINFLKGFHVIHNNFRGFFTSFMPLVYRLSPQSPAYEEPAIVQCFREQTRDLWRDLVAGLSCLQLSLLIAVKNLVEIETSAFNFELVYREYKLIFSRNMADALEKAPKNLALKAFESLFELELLRFGPGATAAIPLDCRPTKLAVPLGVLSSALKAVPNLPMYLHTLIH